VYNDPLGSSKVVDFGINRKPVSDFLLVLDSNWKFLPCFIDIRAFVRQKPLFPYPTPTPAKISGCSLWSRSVMLGSVDSDHPRLTNPEIIFEEF